MKLFLDDIRIPSMCAAYMHKRIGKWNFLYLEDWHIVRNYQEFITTVTLNFDKITHISFDHDLADEHYHASMYEGKEAYEEHITTVTEKTGYDCAVWLKEYYKVNNLELPMMFVHSMNPVGTERIVNIFK